MSKEEALVKAAIAAMQTLMQTNAYPVPHLIAEQAVEYATELVNKLYGS